MKHIENQLLDEIADVLTLCVKHFNLITREAEQNGISLERALAAAVTHRIGERFYVCRMDEVQ